MTLPNTPDTPERDGGESDADALRRIAKRIETDYAFIGEGWEEADAERLCEIAQRLTRLTPTRPSAATAAGESDEAQAIAILRELLRRQNLRHALPWTDAEIDASIAYLRASGDYPNSGRQEGR